MSIDWKILGSSFLTLLIAAIVGWIFSSFGMPLGWLIGSMMVMIVASFFNISAQQPTLIVPYIQASVGTMLGASITLPIILSVADWWPSLLCMLALMLFAGILNFQILKRKLNFAASDAALCSMPGGITEMILMGEQAGADQRRIAIVHAIRIALSIIAIPLIASLVFEIEIKTAIIAPKDYSFFELFASKFEWIYFALCILSGPVAARWTKLPAPLILAPLIVCALLHITGITDFSVPVIMWNIIQVIIGMNVGARFQGISREALANAAISAIIVVVIQITFATAGAIAFAKINSGDALALMLAYSPGGLAEMSLVAVTMGREVAFVGLHHILRVLFCLSAVSLLLHWLKGHSDDA